MPPIERLVVLMLENQSFDRLLGGLAPRIRGLDGVKPDAPLANPDWPSGGPIFQAPTTTRTIAHDPGHDLDNVLRQIDRGSMAGFVADYAQMYPQSSAAERGEILDWYPPGFLPALHLLAEQFVIADHWHASVPGPTWPNRFFAQSGTSLGHTDTPSGIFHPDLHLYDQRTLYDELNSAKVEWCIYYGDFPQSLAFTHQLEPENLARYCRFERFAADVAAADLPPFVFIEPAYLEPEENDQHPPQDILRADVLLADIYNALRAQHALFARTLLIVLHDEHGGFFDHVPPPPTIAPDAHVQNFFFTELGVRVPAVFVSPLLDPGVIATLFDHTSLIRAAGDLWGIAPLGKRAAAANSPIAALTWRDTPRASLPPARRAEVLPGAPVASLNTIAASLFAFSQHIESLIADGAVRERLAAEASAATRSAEAAERLALARLDAFLADA
ncbi:MAG: alkaline phosphatase family protein, partial [Acetobacteraceae bacterium]